MNVRGNVGLRPAKSAACARRGGAARRRSAGAWCGWSGSRTAARANCPGGQQQRVALARALVDPAGRAAARRDRSPTSTPSCATRCVMEIRDIQRSAGITTIFVTHDQIEALTMCDRVAVMNRGRIEQVGIAAKRSTSGRPTRFVAEFVGRGNVLPATARWRRAHPALGTRRCQRWRRAAAARSMSSCGRSASRCCRQRADRPTRA